MSHWFRPKRCGYGATPNTWQGWLVTLGFVALLAAIMSLVGAGGGAVLLAATAILTALFICIAWKKTDGVWRWRWGSKDIGK
jgi:hypothetical protein